MKYIVKTIFVLQSNGVNTMDDIKEICFQRNKDKYTFSKYDQYMYTK